MCSLAVFPSAERVIHIEALLSSTLGDRIVSATCLDVFVLHVDKPIRNVLDACVILTASCGLCDCPYRPSFFMYVEFQSVAPWHSFESTLISLSKADWVPLTMFSCLHGFQNAILESSFPASCFS